MHARYGAGTEGTLDGGASLHLVADDLGSSAVDPPILSINNTTWEYWRTIRHRCSSDKSAGIAR